MRYCTHLASEKDTFEIGKKLAYRCTSPLIIFLYGALGTGKTTFVRGFLRALGIQEAIKSPTYPLVESYELNDIRIFHFDFYRIYHPNELVHIGIQDYLSQQAIFLIEWPEQGAGILPQADVSCYIEFDEKEGRNMIIEAHSTRGKFKLKRLLNDVR